MHFCFCSCLFPLFYHLPFFLLLPEEIALSCSDGTNRMEGNPGSVTPEPGRVKETGTPYLSKELPFFLPRRQPCLVSTPLRFSAKIQWYEAYQADFLIYVHEICKVHCNAFWTLCILLARYIESQDLGSDWSQCQGNMLVSYIVSDRPLFGILKRLAS